MAASKKTPPAAAVPTAESGQYVRLVSLLLALVTVLVYLPVAFHDYVNYDDPGYVTDNPVVQNGLTWAGFQWAFIGWHADNWHPLTWLSLELDCQLFGLNAGAQHLVNALWHAANAVLLFLLWRRLTNTLWPAAFVAALFAWHPAHVESVAWIAERKDVLSTFFGLLALLAYARFAAGRPAAGGGAFFRDRHWGLALLFFALGLLAKPMLVTLPFLLLLLDFWPLRRFTDEKSWWPEGRALVREKWPFFLLAALACVPTELAERQVPLQLYTFDLRLENAVTATAGYLGKIFWPAGLAVIYPLPRHFSPAAVVLATALLLALTGLAWRGRAHRYLLTGWLWFLGMLVPVIGLVQAGEIAMADRYTYLPAVGLFVAAAFGLAEMPRRGKIPARLLALGALFILGACVVVTERQLTFWRNTETLFTHTLAVTKNNGLAHMFLGMELEKQGRDGEARAHYFSALAALAPITVKAADGDRQPLAAPVELLLGQSDEQNDRLTDAETHYRSAVRMDPDDVEAHNNLGNVLDRQGRPVEALAEYQAAVRLRPALPEMHENLGGQLVELGRFDDALAQYAVAARLAPAAPVPFYLAGKAWLRRGDSARAATAFQSALQLDPADSQSLTYLARVRAADESPQNRNGAEAVTLAEQANNLTGGQQPLVLGTLAMAYAETGRYADARASAQAALKAAAGGRPEMISQLEAQLKLYELDQPDREKFGRSPGK